MKPLQYLPVVFTIKHAVMNNFSVIFDQIMSTKTLKCMIQIIFYCLFLWFSVASINSFYLGEVIYDIVIDADNDKVFFPAITLCPNMKINPLMNLKLHQLQNDRNLSSVQLQSYLIFDTLKSQPNLNDIIQNYSFKEEESFNHYLFHMNQIRY